MAEPTISIAYEEMEDSPTEQIGEQGFSATRRLRCNWADRLTLARELTGTFLSGGVYTYDLPHLYPHDGSARCVSVSDIIGHDSDAPTALSGDTKIAAYTKAILTVNYGTRTPTSGGGSSVELTDETIEPFSEFVTLPPDGLTWVNGSGPPLTPDEAVGKLFRGFNWVYTRSNVSSVPSEYASLIGCVNNASITSAALGFTFTTETLLYTPPLLTRKVNPDGVTSKWTIQTKYAYKPQGWNKFWQAASNAYEAIYKGATQIKPYTPADFSPLIP